MPDPKSLLAEELTAWQDLNEVFDRVPADRFEEPTFSPEGWSPKDLMFHIAAWLRQCERALTRIESEPSVTVHDTDEVTDVGLNAAWFEESRAMTLHEVRAEFEAAAADVRHRFASMTNLNANAWAWFEESGPIHYGEHAAQLSAWIDGS